MKKHFFLLIILCGLFTACGYGNPVIKEDYSKMMEVSERKYNANMSEAEFTEVTYSIIEFATDLGDIFSKMEVMSEKYADIINESETFDWSQYWDFREVKEDAITTCDKILTYDDSICSREYQICIDECKSMAFQVKQFFNIVSNEMDINELSVLTQKLSNNVSLSMNYAMVYQTIATISYMETNDADPATIQSLRSQVETDYIYRVTIDDSRSSSSVGQLSYRNVIFTNSYGTPTTKCAHSGCSNTIAVSGDTNCCIIHSNKCFICGKYVDEDAIFCLDCLSGKTTSITDTGKYSGTTVISNGCQYSYFDGSICGESTNKYTSLCDDHFKELYDAYQSFVGK